LRANDRVALLSHNSIEHLAVYLGVMAYGATICTVHVEMNSAHVEDILRALGPRLVLFEEETVSLKTLEAVPGEPMALGSWQGATEFFGKVAGFPADQREPVAGPDDSAAIFYTSGTESMPKGIVYTFADLLANVAPTMDAFGVTADDRLLDFRSFNWMSAQVLSALGTVCRGSTLLLARQFSRSRFFDWIREHKATIAAGNPTTINMLLNRALEIKGADVPHLRFVTSSSAPLLLSDWKRFEETYGITIAQGYGSSETGWIAGSNERTRRLGSVGRPLPYQGVVIVNESGEELPTGEAGAVELHRSPGASYRNLSEDGSIVSKAGGFQTGDLGYFDGDGYLYLTGRDKDLIIRGGINIAPVEIDNVLSELDGVAEAAAVGVPDKIHGEKIIAYVTPRPGVELTADAVLAHCRARLPEAKVPEEVILSRSLPKTPRGKLDRKSLVARWSRENTGRNAEG
jgi:acyl-coenzyme A synthetase/AMP-(fatty) acid ligase